MFNASTQSVEELDSIFSKEDKDITVVNGIGCIPQRKYTDREYTETNHIFPISLSHHCKERNIPLIHISTNCVFSGDRTMQDEECVPDAKDMYGLSKARGEPKYGLVIRTSIIGPERNSSFGLWSWFINSNENIKGYTNHYWNGITTLELAKYIVEVISKKEVNSGLRHLYSDQVSKYDLLSHINNIFNLNKEIQPVEMYLKYYTLTSTKIHARKSIVSQLEELKEIYNDFMSSL
jgi:dTDP-4-dehydrorhamnose reductase